jgi:hypothetical protein
MAAETAPAALQEFLESAIDDRRELQVLLADYFALPDRHRLAFALFALDYDGCGIPLDDPHLSVLMSRAGALQEVERATAYLKSIWTPLDEFPTTRQYKRAADALGLWSLDRVIAPYQGRWNLLKREYLHGRAPETPHMRALRRLLSGRAREHDPYGRCLRRWLDSHPPDFSRSTYNDWARYQKGHPTPGERPPVLAETITHQLSCSWEEAVEYGRGELSPEQLRSRRENGSFTRVDCGPLVGITGAARILGLGGPHAAQAAREPGFPEPALRIHNSRVWWAAAIKAHKKKTQFTPPFDLASNLLLSQDVATLRRISTRSLTVYLAKHFYAVAGKEHLAPRPAGRVCGVNYWWRPSVLEWLAKYGWPLPQRA